MGDKLVFLARKVFISRSFPVAFNAQEMRISLSQRNRNLKLKKQEHLYRLIYSWSDQAIKGTVLNRTLPFLHGASLKITLPVPLSNKNCAVGKLFLFYRKNTWKTFYDGENPQLIIGLTFTECEKPAPVLKTPVYLKYKTAF